MAKEGVLRAVARQLGEGFLSLRGSPQALWLVYLLKVLESYNYFSLSLFFVLYLSEEFGIADVEAGTLYGLWGTLLVLFGFLFGGLIDFLGVRGSLALCFVLNVFGRGVMAATHSRTALLVALMGPVSLSGALGVPVLTIAVKRYTHEGNRGFAFSLYYTFMNMAALGCGLVLDFFRITIKHGFQIEALPADSVLNSGNRLFLVSGCCASLLSLALLPFLDTGAPPGGLHKRAASLGPSTPVASPGNAAGAACLPSPEVPILAHAGQPQADPLPGGGGGLEAVGGKKARERTCLRLPGLRALPQQAAAAWREVKVHSLANAEFWKFAAMCLFTTNVKQVFRHLDATLPKYQVRAFGCAVPVGLVYAINPAMIVVLVPLVGALTTRFSHFDMIHYGSYFSAVAPFWMVAFQAEWSTVLFVVMLSLGEAVWSPRWYDYSMSVAPEGREGIFTAMASAPLFAAKLPTGMLSGKLLAQYCPDNGACDQGGDHPGIVPEEYVCDGRTMWLIIGVITLTSPLSILLFQRWLRPGQQPHPGPGPYGRLRTESQDERWNVVHELEGDPDVARAVQRTLSVASEPSVRGGGAGRLSEAGRKLGRESAGGEAEIEAGLLSAVVGRGTTVSDSGEAGLRQPGWRD